MADTLPKKNIATKALVVEKPGAPFVLMDVLLDEVRGDEVLVEMKYTGLCHTDIVVQQGLMPGGQYPAVLGHEGAGVVRRVGRAVANKTLREGQQVLLSFNSCGDCVQCKTRTPANCEHMPRINFSGVRLSDGSTPVKLLDGTPALGQFFGQSSFSKLAVVHENSVVACELPESDFSMLAPLGCGYQTGAGTVLNALKPEKSTKLAIFGMGAVGLAALMAARSGGVEKIIAVDIMNSKLEIASALGATDVIDTAEQPDLLSALAAAGGVDQIVETTGAATMIAQGISALNHAGTMAIIGTPKPNTPIQIEPLDILLSLKSIIGVIEGQCNPPESIPRLIQLYQQRRFPVDKLGKIYPVHSIEEAILDLKHGSTIKPILSWEGV